MRDAIRAPWLRASSPTTGRTSSGGAARAGCHGSAVSCGARSSSPARYTNDGSWRRGAASPGATSCATSNTCTRGSAARVSTYATAEFVVPRSMPIRYRAGTLLRTAVLPLRHLRRDHQLHEAVHERLGVSLGVAGQRRSIADPAVL